MALLESGIGIYAFWGNTLIEYGIALVVFVGSLVVLKLVQRLLVGQISRLAERTETDIDNALLSIVKTIKPQFYWFLAFYIALRYLDVAGVGAKVVNVVLLTWIVYQAIVALQIFLDYIIKARFIRKDDRASEVVSTIVSSLSKIFLWAVGVLFVLSNVGVNVTSLIAGLGIGGIAIALAAQNILGDLFSSLAIYFDRPFEPGDFVVIGSDKGTVQKVGIKTTRIKSISGEEIVIPNQEITSTRVINARRMKERRIAFTIGVTYDTGLEKMKEIPKIVQNIIEQVDTVKFGRVHFLEFADSSLNFEIVYTVKDREYNAYVDAHQQILLGIKETFEREEIDMAFPTRTVHIVQGQESPHFAKASRDK